MTYGDGVSNVNINELVRFHKKQNKMVSLTAVRPPARFGALKIQNNKVKYLKKIQNGRRLDKWGFFVIEPKFFRFIKNDKTYLNENLWKIYVKKTTFSL